VPSRRAREGYPPVAHVETAVPVGKSDLANILDFPTSLKAFKEYNGAASAGTTGVAVQI